MYARLIIDLRRTWLELTGNHTKAVARHPLVSRDGSQSRIAIAPAGARESAHQPKIADLGSVRLVEPIP